MSHSMHVSAVTNLSEDACLQVFRQWGRLQAGFWTQGFHRGLRPCSCQASSEGEPACSLILSSKGIAIH